MRTNRAMSAQGRFLPQADSPLNQKRSLAAGQRLQTLERYQR